MLAASDAREVAEHIATGPESDTPDALAFSSANLYAGSVEQRLHRVVEATIESVVKTKGGRLEILGIKKEGDIEVRFVGGCANCPYSLLSLEQMVNRSSSPASAAFCIVPVFATAS